MLRIGMKRLSCSICLSIIVCVSAPDGYGQSAPNRRSWHLAPEGVLKKPNVPAELSAQPSNSSPSLPLKMPRAGQRSAVKNRRATTTQSVTTVFASLAIVLGLFFLFAWFTKRNAPRGSSALPREAVEVLGRVACGARQQMQLVRLGNKLVLLSVSSNGTSPLAEVIDPDEVDRLTSLCRHGRDGRSAPQVTSRAIS